MGGGRKREQATFPYRCTDTRLGIGNFGEVFLGVHVDTREEVAMKKISSTNPTAQAELTMAPLANSQYTMKILATHEDEQKGITWIVLEYCAGGNLKEYIAKHGKLEEKDAKRFFLQLCHGMDYLHQKSILHRDIKPENLFFTSSGDLKIGDWGFAVVAGEHADYIGTGIYMSPERLRGEKYDFSAEIYALGIILYEMLVGVHPFPAVRDVHHLLDLQKQGLQFCCQVPFADCCIDLIQRMTQWHSKDRIEMDEILRHKWLSSLSPLPAAHEGQVEKWPTPSNEEAARTIVAVSMSERTCAGAAALLSAAKDLLGPTEREGQLHRKCEQQLQFYRQRIGSDPSPTQVFSASELLFRHARRMVDGAAREEAAPSPQAADLYSRACRVLLALLRVDGLDDEKRKDVENLLCQIGRRYILSRT